MGLSLNEKLDLWVKITGVNPQENKSTYSIYFDGRLSNYDIEKMNKRITESLEYDEIGLFTESYLSLYLKEFIENKKVSIYELMENKELSEFVSDVRLLYDDLQQSNAKNVIEDEAKKAMSFYKLPSDKLDILSILELRTSAMNCINKGKLNLLQFSYGKAGDKFQMSRNIYHFNSLDDLIICSAKGALSGVSLGYINDKDDATDSFFAFIIKNGDNLFLLTDKPDYRHPAQKGMSRCPGRDMANRIESNWFPYDSVAGLNTSDLWDRGRYGIKQSDKEELSTELNEDMPYRIIGNLDNMEQHEAFWVIMMVDLIKKKFFDGKDIPSLPISYTKSMIQTPMLDNSNQLPAVKDNLPALELGIIKDIKDTDGLSYDREERAYDGRYDYLIERYKDKVDTDILNLVKGSEMESRLLEDKSNLKHSYTQWNDEFIYKPLDFSLCATQEELEYNQKWLARYNYAKSINKLVEEDYATNCKKLYEVIKGLIEKRLDELCILHLQGKLKVNRTDFNEEEYEASLSAMNTFDAWYNDAELHTGFDFYQTNTKWQFPNKTGYRCYYDKDKKASVAIRFVVKNADELALLCGVLKEELPVQLQNWGKKFGYCGNSILYNIDPFLWVFKDKFQDMKFSATILISKDKYRELCETAGIDAVAFWKDEQPTCFSNKCFIPEGKCIGKTRYISGRGNVLNKKCETCKWMYREES